MFMTETSIVSQFSTYLILIVGSYEGNSSLDLGILPLIRRDSVQLIQWKSRWELLPALSSHILIEIKDEGSYDRNQ